MMKFMMILMAVALVAVYSSPFLIDDEEKEDFQCCPQDPSTLECAGNGCNDFCCGCQGNCVAVATVQNFQCSVFKCAKAVAKCVKACCVGECIASQKCISCLGKSYNMCKDCWKASETERFTNLILKGVGQMDDN